MVDVSNQLAVPALPEDNEASTVGGGVPKPVGSKPVKPRGRPKAPADDSGEAPKRGRGRPKKSALAADGAKEQKSETIEILAESLRKAGETLSSNFPEDPLNFDVASGASKSGEDIPKAKRSRGRPRKNPDQPPKPRPVKDGPKRGRGRPRKNEQVGRPRKRPLDEAEESPSKQPRTNGDENEPLADVDTAGSADPAPAGGDPAQLPKKKPGRPKKEGASSTTAQNGSSDGGKKRGRPAKNPSGKGPGRPRGRPKKVAQETTEGEPETGKLQVSFSDSESEESEALGKGVKQSGIFPAFSEPQASEAAGASSGVPHHPTAREPRLLNKFDESFDEDSDN